MKVDQNFDQHFLFLMHLRRHIGTKIQPLSGGYILRRAGGPFPLPCLCSLAIARIEQSMGIPRAMLREARAPGSPAKTTTPSRHPSVLESLPPYRAIVLMVSPLPHPRPCLRCDSCMSHRGWSNAPLPYRRTGSREKGAAPTSATKLAVCAGLRRKQLWWEQVHSRQTTFQKDGRAGGRD